MRDHHGTAREGEQGFFQGAQGFDIQVVRGLVQQQHVSPLFQGLCKLQTATFTTGKLIQALLLVVAFEVKATNVGP